MEPQKTKEIKMSDLSCFYFYFFSSSSYSWPTSLQLDTKKESRTRKKHIRANPQLHLKIFPSNVDSRDHVNKRQMASSL
jgi:hypothetical protein